MATRARILFVTDLAYPAQGRRYGDEDVWLAARLRETFDVASCHPRDAAALMGDFDLVLVRNSGPAVHYLDAYRVFRSQALAQGVRVYNPLHGKADMLGKQYLIDLFAAGYPVIPTVDRRAELDRLPAAEAYVVKPKAGSDSVGLRVMTPEELSATALDGGLLVQPRIDLVHEISFYLLDGAFRYALYAPRPEHRWQLEPYRPSSADLAFAQRFVDWNDLEVGIQRVDACRTATGELLLVEVEDLNPYLSLDLIPPDVREAFVTDLTVTLDRLAGQRRS